MTEETIRLRYESDHVQQHVQSRLVLDRLRSHAELSHQLLTQSRELLGRGRSAHRSTVDHVAIQSKLEDGDPVSPEPVDACDEREAIARQRLLEWEAADLAQVVPDEMGTPRRRFAVSLYETVAASQSLGMTEERLTYHVRAALERYRLGE